jgi:hypothetical protein
MLIEINKCMEEIKMIIKNTPHFVVKTEKKIIVLQLKKIILKLK